MVSICFSIDLYHVSLEFNNLNLQVNDQHKRYLIYNHKEPNIFAFVQIIF
jgi:hypothetical protein